MSGNPGGPSSSTPSMFLKDLLLTPDGCAPDDDPSQSSVSQNPIMRMTDQILFGGPAGKMGNESVREKQMQRDRETGETLHQKQRWTADQERQRRMNNNTNGGRQQQRARSDVMARQVAPAMEREYERQLVQQQQQQQSMDQAWRREQEMMAEQRQRDAMMMRERNEVGLMTPAPMMEMQMRQQQQRQDWGGEFAREREQREQQQQRRMMGNNGAEWATSSLRGKCNKMGRWLTVQALGG